MDEIQKHDYPVHGLVIVRQGALVMEAYAPPYYAGSRHYIASATKSVISALVGIAIMQGKISGVDQKILDFFLSGK